MLNQLVQALITLLEAIAALVLAALAWLEGFFTQLMDAAHVPHNAQVLLAIVLAVLVLVAAVRLFGGFVRVVLIVLLVAIVAHAILHPRSLPPAKPQHTSESIHT
jgi:NAD/NADP transhydrogenase alpha subunit